MSGTDSLDELITTREAADLCQVAVSTVSGWRERGHLRVSKYDARDRPLYKMIDVLRAERATRRAAIGANRGIDQSRIA